MSQDPTRAAQDVAASSSTCLTCEQCAQAIQTEYWTVGASLLCTSCRATLDVLKDPPLDRATWRRVLVSGGSAALLGALVHLVIVSLTGAEFGFAALGVGLLVGGAVRKAAAGCGGIKLQIVAMAMTYVAVVTAYVPAVLTGFGAALDQEQAKLKAAGTAAGQGGAVAPVQTSGATEPEPAPAPGAAPDEPVSLGAALLGGVLVIVAAFAVAAAAPWLMVVDSPLVLLILMVALYQAWRLNARVRPVCRGPFAAWQNLPG